MMSNWQPQAPYCSKVNCIYNYSFIVNNTTQEQPKEKTNKVRSARVPNTDFMPSTSGIRVQHIPAKYFVH